MNTKLFETAAAAVTGARHLRLARNGQDAAAAWAGADAAAVVVCDGCSSGASSEVGARLGAGLAIRALSARLAGGARVADAALWTAMRADVACAIEALVDRDLRLLEDCFLFTLIAAAVDREHSAVWALGDGAYALGGAVRCLGPYADNQPPYLAYDLVGAPAPAVFEVAPMSTVIVATDGAHELPDGLAPFGGARFTSQPDALRRELAVLARADEQIDWNARRIRRTAAALQDDCAIGVIRVEAP